MFKFVNKNQQWLKLYMKHWNRKIWQLENNVEIVMSKVMTPTLIFKLLKQEISRQTSDRILESYR